MKQITLVIALFFSVLHVTAQPSTRSIGIAIINTQAARPFTTGSGFFAASLHPGIECSYAITLRNKKHHEWLFEPRLQYFYHRFVQHGIPVYAAIDYRRRFGERWSVSSAIGGGYMFAIPATRRFTLNTSGDYVKATAPWRSQASLSWEVSTGYSPHGQNGARFFITYQVRLQAPFVRSYVPVLPYNTLMIGCSFKLPNKSKSSI